MENVCLTRTFNFCAGHRLFIEGLTEEENINIFDKCANPNGHGHDYKVEVRISDNISDKTGMVIDRNELSEVIDEIREEFDYKRIDKEIDYFKENQSTVENITLYIWGRLLGKFKDRLKYIKVWENERSYFEYYKERIR